MFPNVRLLIVAMLASVVVLICGFGVFAAFRVSHEPFAHLPAAVAPLQLVAENGAASSAALVTRETVDQHSQFDIPVARSEEATAPPGTSGQHDQAELVAQSEQTAAPQPVAATNAEPSAAPEPEKEAVAMPSPEQSPTPSTPASDLPAPIQSSDRSADAAADTAFASSPLRPVEPEADPAAAAPNGPAAKDTAASEAATNETAPGEAAPVSQTTITEASPPNTIAAPGAETEPAAVASIALEAMPDDAAERSESNTPLEPPLPRARPNVGNAQHVSDAQHVSHAQPARAADERPRSAAANRPRRVRVVARTVRAVRFANPYYYAQAQYAQSIDQNYGYGQSNFQGAQEQIVVRRVVRPRPAARLAARRANPAIGGPFVSARSP